MPSLQCVRAFAALLVVYFHAVLQIMLFDVGQNGHAGLTETPFPLFGKCGVDVFFILSGLLMWRTTASGPQSVMEFYGKRVLRIVPLYWLVTAAAVALALLSPGLLKSTRFDPAHVLASLLFVPWPNPAMGGGTDLMTPVVVPGWTLNFEIFFYFVFGLTLALSRRWRLPANLALFGAFIAVVLLFRHRSQTLAFYDPSLVVEFVIGLAFGASLDRDRLMPSTRPKRGVAGADVETKGRVENRLSKRRAVGGFFASAPVILAASAVALCWFDAVPPGTGRLITTAAPALGVIAATVSLDRAGRWPALPLMTRIGDASFSLYLTHVFVLGALRTAFSHAGAPLTRPATQTVFVVASLVLSCAVGLVVYRFVEQPIGAALQHRRRSRRHSSAVRGGSASPGGALSVLPVASTDLTRSSSVSGF